MTETEIIILEIIEKRVGKRNAISRKKLRSKSRISDRKIRQAIHDLVTAHKKMICSDYITGGYYIPANQAELDEAYNRVRSHALHILERASVIHKFDLAAIQKELEF